MYEVAMAKKLNACMSGATTGLEADRTASGSSTRVEPDLLTVLLLLPLFCVYSTMEEVVCAVLATATSPGDMLRALLDTQQPLCISQVHAPERMLLLLLLSMLALL